MRLIYEPFFKQKPILSTSNTEITAIKIFDMVEIAII